MKWLIACEHTGAVRNALTSLGIDATSCDVLPSETEGKHIQGDVLDILDQGWTHMLAHPPCTHLAISGSRHFAAKRADGRQQAALDFVEKLWAAPIPHIAIENPVSIISTQTSLGRCTQSIQPYQFGHPESKRTCFWLKNLPKLQHTNVLELPERGYWDNQTPSRQNNASGTKDKPRWAVRSKTYEGIAKAIASQWGLKQLEPV
tara:strand:- start:39 stop:650 length:612 start_codon:yes stop_codon:yes gene_type:complete